MPIAVPTRASTLTQRLALFLFVLSLASCVTWTPRSAHPSASATVIPNMPMQKWGIESCGAGSLSTVLQHYGDPTSMAEWDATLPKTRGGVLTIDMILAARKKGFDANLVTGTPTLIEQELQQGRPAILMLQVIFAPGQAYDFFHYIIVDGVDPERNLVRTQFGDGKPRWLPFQRLEKAWNGGGHAAILIHDDVGAALRAAVALEDEGKYGDAAERYRAIVQHHPDSALALTDLANAETKLGHSAEAEDAFRKALAIDPSSRDALNNLAWLLYQNRRLDEAESLARKAIAEPGPDSYLILDTLAHVLAAKGACDEAMRTFQQAIDAVPSSRAEARADIESGLAAARRTCS